MAVQTLLEVVLEKAVTEALIEVFEHHRPQVYDLPQGGQLECSCGDFLDSYDNGRAFGRHVQESLSKPVKKETDR